MSSITAQQTKLDLELVPKEKRLVIRKSTFQVKWDEDEEDPEEDLKMKEEEEDPKEDLKMEQEDKEMDVDANEEEDGPYENCIKTTRRELDRPDFESISSLEASLNLEIAVIGGFVDKFLRDPNKTPNSSQRAAHNCPKCGNPVDGLYCRQCALLRKKLKKIWFTICDENEIFQDFLNISESSNDNTNFVNAPQEPFVFNQGPDENSSQSPPHIDYHCCYGCGDSLDAIFCQRCTCESCGNSAHYGYNCPPKVLIISNSEQCYNQNVDEFPQTLPSFHPTCYSGDENSFTYDSNLNFVGDSPNQPPQPPMYSYEFCGKDAHYSHDCPP
nr:hypothetical protein [Tanacetum cinerariifolium]